MVCAIAGAGLAAPAVAQATTAPSPYAVIHVVISDESVAVSRNHESKVTYVLFYVRNAGKRMHNLVIGDEHTGRLRPGEQTQFAVTFPDAGTYVLRSGVNPTRHEAKLHISQPIRPD